MHAQYSATVPPEAGRINIDVTYPATEKHISKATEQDYFMVNRHRSQHCAKQQFHAPSDWRMHTAAQVSESPADYRAVTLPFIEAMPQSRLQWVYNILDKTARLSLKPCSGRQLPS